MDGLRGHDFHVYEPRVWSNYPKALRDKYSSYLYTEAAGGGDGEIFVTEELCHEILRDENIFLELTRFMNEAYARHLQQAIQAYANFTVSQQSSNLRWPDFCHGNFEQVFKAPNVKPLKKILTGALSLFFHT